MGFCSSAFLGPAILGNHKQRKGKIHGNLQKIGKVKEFQVGVSKQLFFKKIK